MTKKMKSKSPEKWYAGSPERYGDSSSKMIIYYGNGNHPSGGRRKLHPIDQAFHDAMLKSRNLEVSWRSDPYFSYDWKSRWKSKSSINPEVGIEELKELLQLHVDQYNVSYATISESTFKGRVLYHWSLNTGWVDDGEWFKQKQHRQTKKAPMFRAWVCFTPQGHYYRKQNGEKHDNIILWSQENLTDRTDKVFAIQTILNQLLQINDWASYIKYVWIYDETDKSSRYGKKVGNCQFKVITKQWQFFPEEEELKRLMALRHTEMKWIGQMEEMFYG
jgi:hypothetical protein